MGMIIKRGLPKILTCLIFCFNLEVQGQVPVENPSPKAIFQAVFWEQDISGRLIYAPWGNALDQNATLLDLAVYSSRLSQKFLYYGSSPLTLYELDETDNGDLISEKKPKLKLVYEYEFNDQGGMKEEILFLMNSGHQSRVKGFSFTASDTGNGTYRFVSFTKENSYIAVGEQKFSLPPGGSKNINLSADESQNARMIIYLRRNDQYKQVYSRKVMNHKKKRGIFFLRAQGDSIKVMPIIDNQSSALADSIGYGEPPYPKRESTVDKNNTKELK